MYLRLAKSAVGGASSVRTLFTHSAMEKNKASVRPMNEAHRPFDQHFTALVLIHTELHQVCAQQ
jgi:hypothetical protein